jgi:carboxypeptidase Taq
VDALTNLRGRMAELADLAAIGRLGEWDQLVMMPPDGAPWRASQMATLARIAHERAAAEDLGGWLDELAGADLDELDADMVRLARRDFDRTRRVPAELAAEIAHASAIGQETWQRARAHDDFAEFAPALERNVELAREHARCLAEPGQSRYEALLANWDYGLTTAELRRLFAVLSERLPALIDSAREHSPPSPLDVPVDIQRRAVAGVLARVGVDESSWRVDTSAHPFTSWLGPRDSRITTRYTTGDVESLLSSLHEFGHALYERQIDERIERTSLGAGTSMSIHESQSKLWENHVARNPAFAEVLAAELAAAGFEVDAPRLHASMVGVERTLIRVSADPLTYPLHIILRFELELALIEGELEVAGLPAAWGEGMQRLIGCEVPSDAAGCLQDVHWGAGAFGYFPSYALGCVIAAQLWEALERDLGPRGEELARGQVGPIKQWLGERVHRHGRRLDTLPLVEAATGAPLDAEAFLRYVEPLAGTT